MQKEAGSNGLHIYKVKGWDYAGMCEVFEEGIRQARETHTPVLFHVEEITQPQGHSTSGSHERYKNAERLDWERDWDGIKKMREWIIENALAEEEEINEIEKNAKLQVRENKATAWEKYLAPIKNQVSRAIDLINNLANSLPQKNKELQKLSEELSASREPLRRDVLRILNAALDLAGNNDAAFWTKDYYNDLLNENKKLYNTHLYNEGSKSALNVKEVKPIFVNDASVVNGFEILNKYFD